MSNRKGFRQEEMAKILGGIQRMMTRRKVSLPVRLRFPSTDGGEVCWERQCKRRRDGSIHCEWVRVPC